MSLTNPQIRLLIPMNDRNFNLEVGSEFYFQTAVSLTSARRRHVPACRIGS
jgi:hypothetical protein